MKLRRGTTFSELPDPASSNLTPYIDFTVLSEGLFESRPSFLEVGFPDDADTVPSGTSLEVCATVAPETLPPCTPHSLGAVTELPQAFPLRDLGSQSDSATIHYSLVSQSGATIGTYNVSFGSLDPTNPSNAIVTNAGSSLQTAVPIMSFVVALGAGLVGYTGYAKDRLNGSLDPALALPVTRTRLILSRYVASMAVVGTGTAVGAMILGLALPSVSSTPVPASIWLGLVATFVAEAAIFVGLMFLAAHLTRSGSLLLVGLVLLVTLLTLLWYPLVILTGRFLGVSSNRAVGSTGFLLNPAQSATSIVGYLAFRLDGGRPLLIPTTTNPGILSALVLVWVAVPILLAWVIFQHRD
ncbi:MAG: ABC transporter permease subunit [Thermoplasmata archaeon]